MSELYIFLRYGLSGYVILFFDLLFYFSLLGPHKSLDVIKSADVGLIFVSMGLPVGWVCYQLRDWFDNKVCIPERLYMTQMRKWEKETGCANEKELNHRTIKVIAGIAAVSDVNCDLTGTDIRTISKDARTSEGRPYTKAYQARTAVMFSLPVLTYLTYALILFWWWIGNHPKDPHFTLLSLFMPIFLPVLVALVARVGLDRVRDEEDLYWFILIKDKENYVKGLIRQFLVSDHLPLRLFRQPRTRTNWPKLHRLLCRLICGKRKTSDEDK